MKAAVLVGELEHPCRRGFARRLPFTWEMDFGCAVSPSTQSLCFLLYCQPYLQNCQKNHGVSDCPCRWRTINKPKSRRELIWHVLINASRRHTLTNTWINFDVDQVFHLRSALDTVSVVKIKNNNEQTKDNHCNAAAMFKLQMTPNLYALI